MEREMVIEVITIKKNKTWRTTIRYVPQIDGDIWEFCHRIHQEYGGATAWIEIKN